MWKKKKSSHYIFTYHKDSFVEKDIAEIIEIQESCYEYICEVLKVKMNRTIHYFLCELPEEVGRMYGDDESVNGIIKMPDKIYAVYNEKVKCIGFHEDVHLIAYNTLGKPKQSFLREGLAMFFDKVWWRIPNEAWVQVYINTGLYPKLSTLTEYEEFHRYKDIITYPIAGVFVDYLISIFGIEKFKVFFKTVDENFDKCFLRTFGISLKNFEDKLTKYVKIIEYNKCIYDAIYKHLKKNRLLK
jgi:hypothetical protein